MGVVTSVVLYMNDWRSPIITFETLPPEDSSKLDTVHDDESPSENSTATEPDDRKGSNSTSKVPGTPGLLATAVAFGALIFLTSFLFAEVSVITRWCVAPHPFPGPQPHPWGSVGWAGPCGNE